jgi:hypothetical protein
MFTESRWLMQTDIGDSSEWTYEVGGRKALLISLLRVLPLQGQDM